MCKPRFARPRFSRSRPGNCCVEAREGRGQRSSGRDGAGNRGEGTEKTRRVRVAHHRLTPHDADRLVHEQLRGPDRDGRNRAHDAAPDLGVHLPRDEGWTVTPSPRGVVRGKLRRPAPPYRSGTTTTIAAGVPARAAGETDGCYDFRKPRTRRTRRNAWGGRPEANVGTFREEIVFALRKRRVRVSPGVAERLTSSSRRA
jgi:hypothetical protein